MRADQSPVGKLDRAAEWRCVNDPVTGLVIIGIMTLP
jgi:hypothetical protein